MTEKRCSVVRFASSTEGPTAAGRTTATMTAAATAAAIAPMAKTTSTPQDFEAVLADFAATAVQEQRQKQKQWCRRLLTKEKGQPRDEGDKDGDHQKGAPTKPKFFPNLTELLSKNMEKKARQKHRQGQQQPGSDAVTVTSATIASTATQHLFESSTTTFLSVEDHEGSGGFGCPSSPVSTLSPGSSCCSSPAKARPRRDSFRDTAARQRFLRNYDATRFGALFDQDELDVVRHERWRGRPSGDNAGSCDFESGPEMFKFELDQVSHPSKLYASVMRDGNNTGRAGTKRETVEADPKT